VGCQRGGSKKEDKKGKNVERATTDARACSKNTQQGWILTRKGRSRAKRPIARAVKYVSTDGNQRTGRGQEDLKKETECKQVPGERNDQRGGKEGGAKNNTTKEGNRERRINEKNQTTAHVHPGA